MKKKPSHSPHSPDSLAQKTGRLAPTHSPSPFIRGGCVCVCPGSQPCQCNTDAPGEWPPEWARLPNLDTLEAISRGEQSEQLELFHEPVDDSRAARLARILANVEGVKTANTMEAQP